MGRVRVTGWAVARGMEHRRGGPPTSGKAQSVTQTRTPRRGRAGLLAEVTVDSETVWKTAGVPRSSPAGKGYTPGRGLVALSLCLLRMTAPITGRDGECGLATPPARNIS